MVVVEERREIEFELLDQSAGRENANRGCRILLFLFVSKFLLKKQYLMFPKTE